MVLGLGAALLWYSVRSGLPGSPHDRVRPSVRAPRCQRHDCAARGGSDDDGAVRLVLNDGKAAPARSPQPPSRRLGRALVRRQRRPKARGLRPASRLHHEPRAHRPRRDPARRARASRRTAPRTWYSPIGTGAPAPVSAWTAGGWARSRWPSARAGAHVRSCWTPSRRTRRTGGRSPAPPPRDRRLQPGEPQ